MASNKDSLSVGVRHEQRSVSICEDRVVMWPSKEHEETGNHLDRKESTASFFNPAINFARRMSLKITGNRGIILSITPWPLKGEFRFNELLEFLELTKYI